MTSTRPPTPRPDLPADWRESEASVLLQRVLALSGEARLAMASRLGLNASEVDAMEHLMREPLGPVELARRLGMTSASASVLVDRLEEAGHVRREPHPQDGRRRVVRPTARGLASVYGEVGPLVADIVAAEDGLSVKERAAVARYLRGVVGALEASVSSVSDQHP